MQNDGCCRCVNPAVGGDGWNTESSELSPRLRIRCSSAPDLIQIHSASDPQRKSITSDNRRPGDIPSTAATALGEWIVPSSRSTQPSTRDLQIDRLRSNLIANRIGRYDWNRIGRIYRSTPETCESAICVRIEYESNQKRCADASFQYSNTLNNTGVWSPIELTSLYTVPLSAVNGLSRLTTTSNGQARPIRKLSNRPMTFESNRNGRFESNLEASQVPTFYSPWDGEMSISFRAYTDHVL